MQKAGLYILIILSLIIEGNIQSQTCPSSNYSISRQSQVDSFPLLFPNCNSLPGDLIINGDVRNLDSLIQIDSIFGSLKAMSANSLKNFWGLRNLRYLGTEFNISNNDSLINFRGLEGIQKISYLNIAGNASLKNLRGLDSLEDIISLYLVNNASLDSLSGLESIDNIWNIFIVLGNSSLRSLKGLNNIFIESLSVVNNDSLKNLEGLDDNIQLGRSLTINGNDGLLNLKGLENFSSIPGSLQISGNSKIQNLVELAALKYVGESLTIAANQYLLSLAGLDSLEKVEFVLGISDNNKLPSLDGLYSIDSIGQSLSIRGNDSLTSLNALSNLKFVGGSLLIWDNDQLRKLNGLDSLQKAGGLNIRANKKLNSLWALRKLKWISGEVRLAENDSLSTLKGLDSADFSTVNPLFIYDSPVLEICAVKSVCDYLATNKIAYILNNAPGCNDTIEVQNKCASIGLNEKESLDFTIYPNPSSSGFSLEIDSYLDFPITMYVYDLNGKMIHKSKRIYSHRFKQTDLGLEAGVYLIKLSSNSKTHFRTQKLYIQ